METKTRMTGEFVRLNREQRRIVDEVRPYEGDFEFFEKLEVAVTVVLRFLSGAAGGLVVWVLTRLIPN